MKPANLFTPGVFHFSFAQLDPPSSTLLREDTQGYPVILARLRVLAQAYLPDLILPLNLLLP